MNILFFIVPVAIFMGVIFLSAFIWITLHGQYDDLDTPPKRILLPENKQGEPINAP
jgi:cbb3-type cytochrome oxidase maturation protein